jgi:HEAT repeat protein
MTVSRRTGIIVGIIVVILVAVVGVTRWQRSVATRKLLTDLPGDEYSKVMDAMTQLRQRGRSVAPALLKHLEATEAPARWRSAELLGEVGGRSAWAPLTTALADAEPPVREAAALSLGKLKATPAAEAIRTRLADKKEDVGVRIACAQALALLEDRTSAGALTAILADHPAVPPPAPPAGSAAAKAAAAAPAPPPDTTIELRMACAQAAGVSGDPQLIQPLVAAADAAVEPSAEVRTAAAYALGDLAAQVSDSTHAQALMAGLIQIRDAKLEKVGDVRAAAILSLARVSVPPAAQASLEKTLGECLSDDFYWAREAAKKTMKSLNMAVPS